VVGAGIAGLTCAHHLHGRHDLSVFEAASRPGGHAHTVDVEVAGRSVSVDTGFIVYNERTYPHFSRMLSELGVPTRPSEMSFSVRCERSGLEYGGGSLGALFAQPRNLVRPAFLRMVRDVLRFFREAEELLGDPDPKVSLGDWLDGRGYSRGFQEWHLLPMAGAIWSAAPEQMRDFPAASFARFFHNHGLLSLRDRPVWRTVVGGSRRYVEALSAPFRDRLRLGCPVLSVARTADGVVVRSAAGAERFDQVVLACHTDQALRLLADPDPTELQLLSAIRYQEGETLLHTDARMLPRAHRARSSWNAHLLDPGRERGGATGAAVTYDMKRLQGLELPGELCVTLGASEAVDPAAVLGRFRVAHPLLDAAALDAQTRLAAIQGRRRTWLCGAGWGYGFHEDGVRSARAVVERLDPGALGR